MKFLKSIVASFIGTCMALYFGMILFSFSILLSQKNKTSLNTEEEMPSTIVHLNLEGEIPEHVNDPFARLNIDLSLFDDAPEKMGLWEIRKTLKHLAEDKNVKVLYIKLDSPSLSLSQYEELSKDIQFLKSSGKKVILYSNNFNEVQYYFSSFSNKIIQNPAGSFEWNGLSMSPFYFKRLLNKFNLYPRVYKVGKYKSFGEMFTNEKMSKESRKQLVELQNDLWYNILKTSSNNRNLKVEELTKLANENPPISPYDAFNFNLVDKVQEEWKFIEQIKKEFKVSEFLDFGSYYKRNKSKMNGQSEKNKIGLIFLDGEIAHGKTKRGISDKSVVKKLQKISKDKDIKVLILRINSPGGSALASDIIYEEIESLKSKGVYVIASLSSQAASGGYYIASAANYIITSESTITGSVGVFGLSMRIDEFLKDEVGVTFETVKTGPYADMGSSIRKISENEKSFIQSNIQQIYNRFISQVEKNRKRLPKSDEYGEGRVWSGKMAKELGLIDSFGGLTESINYAVKKMRYSDYSVKIIEEKGFGKILNYINLLTDFNLERVINKNFEVFALAPRYLYN